MKKMLQKETKKKKRDEGGKSYILEGLAIGLGLGLIAGLVLGDPVLGVVMGAAFGTGFGFSARKA